MAAVNRRVHFAQLAALACQPLDKLAALPSSSAFDTKHQRRVSPNPNWFQDWVKVQREEDHRVIAMLRKLIGPDGELNAAYRTYWAARQRGHTLDIIMTLTNLSRQSKATADSKSERDHRDDSG